MAAIPVRAKPNSPKHLAQAMEAGPESPDWKELQKDPDLAGILQAYHTLSVRADTKNYQLDPERRRILVQSYRSATTTRAPGKARHSWFVFASTTSMACLAAILLLASFLQETSTDSPLDKGDLPTSMTTKSASSVLDAETLPDWKDDTEFKKRLTALKSRLHSEPLPDHFATTSRFGRTTRQIESRIEQIKSSLNAPI